MSTLSVSITFTFPEGDPELRRAVLAALDRLGGLGAVDLGRIDLGTPKAELSTPSAEEPGTDPGFVAHLRDAGDRTRRFWSVLGSRAGSGVPIDDISAELGLTLKQTPGVLSVISRSLDGRGLQRFLWTWDRNKRELMITAEIGALVRQALREVGFEE